MDIEKLIEQLNDFNENHIAVLCGSGQCACGYLCDKDDCIVVRAATALSTLQAENEKLREKIEDARLKGYAKGLSEMSEENEKLQAELEQMKVERDAAVDCCSGYCASCLFVKDCAKHDVNDAAPTRWYYGDCEDWEWRGPQKEE